MNVYFTDAGWITIRYGEYDPPEDWRAVRLVAAAKPAQARYLAWKADPYHLGDLHEQTWKHTRLIAKDVDLPLGLVEDDSPYWGYTCEKCWGTPCCCYPCDDEACLLRAGAPHYTSGCPKW